MCTRKMCSVEEKLSILDSMDCTKTSSASRSLALINFMEHAHLVEDHALVEIMISSLRKFENSSELEREMVLGIIERTACSFIGRTKQSSGCVSINPMNFFSSCSLSPSCLRSTMNLTTDFDSLRLDDSAKHGRNSSIMHPRVDRSCFNTSSSMPVFTSWASCSLARWRSSWAGIISAWPVWRYRACIAVRNSLPENS
jgi:hypothetical protein